MCNFRFLQSMISAYHQTRVSDIQDAAVAESTAPAPFFFSVSINSVAQICLSLHQNCSTTTGGKVKTRNTLHLLQIRDLLFVHHTGRYGIGGDRSEVQIPFKVLSTSGRLARADVSWILSSFDDQIKWAHLPAAWSSALSSLCSGRPEQQMCWRLTLSYQLLLVHREGRSRQPVGVFCEPFSEAPFVQITFFFLSLSNQDFFLFPSVPTRNTFMWRTDQLLCSYLFLFLMRQVQNKQQSQKKKIIKQLVVDYFTLILLSFWGSFLILFFIKG